MTWIRSWTRFDDLYKGRIRFDDLDKGWTRFDDLDKGCTRGGKGWMTWIRSWTSFTVDNLNKVQHRFYDLDNGRTGLDDLDKELAKVKCPGLRGWKEFYELDKELGSKTWIRDRTEFDDLDGRVR